MPRAERLLLLASMAIGLPIAVVTGVSRGAAGLAFGIPVLLVFIAIAWHNRAREEAWWLPLGFILIVPAVTVPLQSVLLEQLTNGFAHNASAYHQFGTVADAGQCTPIYDGGYDLQWSCPRVASALTLVPGVLIFGVLAWLRASDRRARRAAVVAAALGVLRFGVPLAVYFSQSDVELVGSYQFFERGTVHNATPDLSLALWALSLLVLLALVAAHRLPNVGPRWPARHREIVP